jgi:hypothetical protein
MATITSYAKAKSGVSGLGAKTYIVTIGVGGGAMSQAQLDGILKGLQAGVSLVNGNAKTDAFTVVGIADTFTAASSTSAVVAIQGTGTPSTTTGEYYAANTLAITNTFSN